MHKQLIGSVKHLTLPLVAAASPLQEKAERSGKRGSGAAAPDNRTEPFAEEAERSGKRGYCAAFNEALPVQQRLEALHKVCALAFAFSAAHIQRAPLHSAQRYTVRSATQCAAMHSAQRCTAPSATQRPALHCAQRFTAHIVAQCATLYTTPPPALHSAQHYTAPSTTLHRAQ